VRVLLLLCFLISAALIVDGVRVSHRRAVVSAGVLPKALETNVNLPLLVTSFQESFNTSTQSRRVPPGWDMTIQADRNEQVWDTDFSNAPMPNCNGGNVFQEPETAFEYSVYACPDHVIAKIHEEGYGYLLLTPPAIVDFSSGEAVIRWDQSTIKTSARDWLELWITPPADHILLAADRWGNTRPKNALAFRMETQRGTGGTTVWRLSRYTDYQEEDIVRPFNVLEDVIVPSDQTLSTYELRISRTHIKFGIPSAGLIWIDQDIADLGWDTGVIQIGPSSYAPRLPCTYPDATGVWDKTCGPTAWHFDNFSIVPARSFTIIRSDVRKLRGPDPSADLTFAKPAPANALLKFSGRASQIEVSFDQGQTWHLAQVILNNSTNVEGDEKSDDYKLAMPAGATSVRFRGEAWFGGAFAWEVENISIYAFPTP
jgi:hypothetical protein